MERAVLRRVPIRKLALNVQIPLDVDFAGPRGHVLRWIRLEMLLEVLLALLSAQRVILVFSPTCAHVLDYQIVRPVRPSLAAAGASQERTA